MKHIYALATIGLLVTIAVLLWKLLQKDSLPGDESDGGASPEWIRQNERNTEEARKQLNLKKKADEVAPRLGR